MLLLQVFCILSTAVVCLELLQKDILIVKQGEDANFQWRLTPKPDRYDTVIITDNNEKIVVFLTYSDSIKTDKYFNRLNISTESFKNGLIKFCLRGVQMTDAGVYTATYGGTTYKGQELVFLSKPDLPAVQVMNNVFESEDLVLNCSTRSKSVQIGNVLQMKYKWYFDRLTELKNQTRFEERNSTLRIQQITRKDSGKIITCKAFERDDAMSEMSKQLVLDVKYAPSKLFISPDYLKYRLPEGRSLQDIRCNSECNPACSFKWVKYQSDWWRRNTIKRGKVLLLKNVSLSDSGIYICNASNEFGEKQSKDIHVVVSNAPSRPEIIALNPPLEGRDLKLKCLSNDSSMYDVDKISWNTNSQHGQQMYRYETQGNILKLNNLRNSDNGTAITCKVSALNVISVESYPYEVVTLFAPRNIKLSTNITHFINRPGDVMPDVHCEIQCRPKCELSWYKNVHTKVQNGKVLSLGLLELDKTGQYDCVAKNVYGIVSKTIYIDIYDITLKQNSTCVKGKSIQILCNVVTNKINILFLQWMQSINQTKLKSIIGNIKNRSNLLEIRNCSMEHVGQYSCRIQINDHAERSASTDLSVLGKPIIISYKTIVSTDYTFASIVVYFYSVPSPFNVTWFRNSSLLRKSDNINMFWDHGKVQKTIFNKTVYYDGFYGQINIFHPRKKDYGLYIFEIFNHYGKTIKKINLYPAEPASITLIWFILAGSIGGTILISLLILIFVVRRHRRKMRQLKIKETLERIRQRLALKENQDIRFGEMNDTGFNVPYTEDQYQHDVFECLEMQSGEYIQQEVSSSSDSFVYDYPDEIAAGQQKIEKQGSYEAMTSDRNPSSYGKIEEYDDTAVPILKHVSHSSKTQVTKDFELHIDYPSTNMDEPTYHPSTESFPPLNNKPIDTNIVSEDKTESTVLEFGKTDTNGVKKNPPIEKILQAKTQSSSTIHLSDTQDIK